MKHWLLLLCLLPLCLHAQTDFQYSVSNFLRYGNGDERVNSVAFRRDYFENLTETRLAFSDFLIGFRLLHDAPPEFGVEFTGLKRRYLEFRKDDLYIRAGNSFSLYGRGLALNLFENRALGYDMALDGVKMEYQNETVKLGITAGDIRYLDVLDLSRIEEYRVRAGSIEVTPYKMVAVGMNFVSGKFKLPPPAFPDLSSQFHIPEWFVRGRWSGFDLFASYAEKRTLINNDTNATHKGTAFYGSLSYAGKAYGITFEYKDYRYGIADPYERLNGNRAYKAFAFQNAPIVHKEHSFTLLSRYPHVIDFNDEVGFQFDVFYTALQNVTGNFNFAMSSRHYSFSPTGDTSAIFLPLYGSKPRSHSWLPTLDRKFSPFWELYFDFQYYFEEGGTDYAQVGFNRRSEDIADELRTPANPKGSVESRRLTSIPIVIEYTLSEGWTLKLTSESQWVYDDGNKKQRKFYNHLFAVSVARSPTYSVTFRYEITSDRGTIDDRRNWPAIDGSYKFTNSHLLTLTVGGDRGGQICSNGVCRVVNPFLGFRASITSYL